MAKFRSMALIVLALLCSACGQQLTCDSPQPYQASVEVEKLSVPEGLDLLLEGKEMDIPRASPQDPRPEGSPCLDLPPTIQSTALRGAADDRRGSNAQNAEASEEGEAETEAASDEDESDGSGDEGNEGQ